MLTRGTAVESHEVARAGARLPSCHACTISTRKRRVLAHLCPGLLAHRNSRPVGSSSSSSSSSIQILIRRRSSSSSSVACFPPFAARPTALRARLHHNRRVLLAPARSGPRLASSIAVDTRRAPRRLSRLRRSRLRRCRPLLTALAGARAFRGHVFRVFIALAELCPILALDVLVRAQTVAPPGILWVLPAPAASLRAMLGHEPSVARAVRISLPLPTLGQEVRARDVAQLARELAVVRHEGNIRCAAETRSERRVRSRPTQKQVNS